MRRTCVSCGAPANVRRTREVNGVATIRDLCRACAEAELAGAPEGPGRPKFVFTRAEYGLILWVVGAFSACLAALADWLRIGRSEGLGWRQLSVFGMAVVVVLLAALSRSLVLIAIGLAIGAVALLADQLRIGGSPGFGPRQWVGLTLGLAMIALGYRLLKRP